MIKNLSNILNKKIKYSDNTYYDLFNYIGNYIINWTNSYEDFEIYIDNRDFIIQFIFFLDDYNKGYYNNYNNSNIKDYVLYNNFSDKYNDDFLNLYNSIKNITKSYGLDIFHRKNDNYNMLIEFIYKYINIYDISIYDINDNTIYDIYDNDPINDNIIDQY